MENKKIENVENSGQMHVRSSEPLCYTSVSYFQVFSYLSFCVVVVLFFLSFFFFYFSLFLFLFDNYIHANECCAIFNKNYLFAVEQQQIPKCKLKVCTCIFLKLLLSVAVHASQTCLLTLSKFLSPYPFIKYGHIKYIPC